MLLLNAGLHPNVGWCGGPLKLQNNKFSTLFSISEETSSHNSIHTPMADTLPRSAAQVQIKARAEPLNEEGSPPHREA